MVRAITCQSSRLSGAASSWEHKQYYWRYLERVVGLLGYCYWSTVPAALTTTTRAADLAALVPPENIRSMSEISLKNQVVLWELLVSYSTCTVTVWLQLVVPLALSPS